LSLSVCLCVYLSICLSVTKSESLSDLFVVCLALGILLFQLLLPKALSLSFALSDPLFFLVFSLSRDSLLRAHARSLCLLSGACNDILVEGKWAGTGGMGHKKRFK